MSNKQILDSILKNLKPQDLQKSREVNKQWNSRSTKILLRKQSFKVTLIFQNNPKNNCEPKLIALRKTLETSQKLRLPFPSLCFVFHSCDLANRAFQHLLSTFGHLFHTLDISFGNGHFPEKPIFLSRFKKLVLDKLPDLRGLALACEKFEDREFVPGTSGICKSTCYPKLKTVRVQSELPGHIFEFLIQGGVNIQEIELKSSYANEHLLEALRCADKTHLLTSTYAVFRQNNLDLIDHLGKAKPSLRMLQIYLYQDYHPPEYYLQASIVVSRLLHTCTKSLQIFQTQTLSVFPEFEVPIFPRLTHLLIVVPLFCYQVFPTKRFKISKVFPRLKFMSMSYHYDFSSMSIEELYGNDFVGADYEDEAFSVEYLNLETQNQELHCFQGERLQRLFTNLKTVRISHASNISEVLEALWDLPVVEVVDLSVGIQDNNSLDSALTGISEEAFAVLFDSISEKHDAATINSFRVKNSMLDAKCLRQLFIRINDDSEEEMTCPIKTILSEVAGKYAFKMCPQVKVCITLKTKHQNSLKYLIPGVSSVLNCSMKIVEKKTSDNLREYYLTF